MKQLFRNKVMRESKLLINTINRQLMKGHITLSG